MFTNTILHLKKIKKAKRIKMNKILPCSLILLSMSHAIQGADTPTEVDQPIELETMSVVNTTPLGADIALNKVTTNVQVMTAEDMARAQSISIADYMNQYMGSVSINDAQNNPLTTRYPVSWVYCLTVIGATTRFISVYQWNTL